MTYRVQDAPELLRPYLTHGVSINEDPEKAKGDCPFCGSSNKFGVITATGQFNCFICHQSGNIYTFMNLLHEQALGCTPGEGYQQLATQRQHSVEGLKRFGLARNPLNDEWFTPGYNTQGKLNNLYRIIPVGGPTPRGGRRKYQILSTPGCKVGLFGKGLINSDCTEIYAAEGLWDGIALWEYHNEYAPANPAPPIGIMACPGSGNFQPEWFALCNGKALNLCFDNDHPKLDDHGQVRLIKGQPIQPGWDGMQRIHSLVLKQPPDKPRPSTLKMLNWSAYSNSERGIKPCSTPGHHANLPDGFDLRDLIRTEASDAWATLCGLLAPITLDPPPEKSGTAAAKPAVIKTKPVACYSFNDLCGHYDKNLHFTQELRDTLAVMLSVVFSTTLPEEQLWFRIIGPPGSGKSTLAEAISAAREYVKPVSLMTGFHSGYVDYDDRGRRKTDASPLLKLMNMCLIWKDADTLINSTSCDRVMGEARDLFDGTSRSQYRNKAGDEFEGLRMSWMLCGTNSLRALNRTFLGERFLDCEIIGHTTDTSPFVKRAISNTYTALAGAFAAPVNGELDDDHLKPDRLMRLKQVTYGFIQHLKTTPPVIPTMSSEVERMIEAHGNYLVFMRARIERDGIELAYRPVLELPTRLASQTVKLAFCLAIILGKPSIDDEVLRIVKKVVHNSAVGFHQEIAKVIADSPLGISVMSIGITLNLPETSIRRILTDLQEFKIVQRKQRHNNSGQRGRDVHMWELTPPVRELWDIVFPKTSPPVKENSGETPNNGRTPAKRRPRNPKPVQRVPHANHQANRRVHRDKNPLHKAIARKAGRKTHKTKGEKRQ